MQRARTLEVGLLQIQVPQVPQPSNQLSRYPPNSQPTELQGVTGFPGGSDGK